MTVTGYYILRPTVRLHRFCACAANQLDHFKTGGYGPILLSNLLPQTPSCTTAFNSTIILISGRNADLFSPVWTDNLHDAYQEWDPAFVPGAPIYRWPSVSRPSETEYWVLQATCMYMYVYAYMYMYVL